MGNIDAFEKRVAMGWIIALIALAVIVVLLVLYVISCQRTLVNLKEYIRNSLSNIGVQQQSRWDALQQVAKSAKAYKTHESETLVNLTQARSGIVANNVQEVRASERDFATALANLHIVAEAYPELKANTLYSQTMSSIDEYENKVRMSRQVYNDCVTKYNRMVKQLPSSIVASMLHYVEEQYLEFDKATAVMPDLDL